MRIGLHLQIFIGLILGVLLGISFPTTYKITNDTISKLEAVNVPEKVINTLKIGKKEFAETKGTFIDNLRLKLNSQTFNTYKHQITQASKHNLYLPYISWIGELFLRLLSIMIVPMIISSIASSVANIRETGNLAMIGIKTFFYYLCTGFLAVITGLMFVHITNPGVGINIDLDFANTIVEPPNISFFENFKNIIPTSLSRSIAEGHNISVIFFSLLIGLFATVIPENYKKPLTQLFDAFYELIISITEWIIKFAPLGIMAIIAVAVSETDNFKEISMNLGKYIFTVLISLFFHSAITLPFILKFIFKVNPRSHYKAMRSALLTAFATSSSNITLPMTMSLVSKKSGVSKKISGFTLPLGTTVNIDGTALYELIAVFFIAQAYSIELSLIEIIIVSATTMFISIGSGNTPMTSLVIMSIILNTVGLPVEGIALVVIADRLLEMFKSAVKVWSDSCGAVIISKSEGENLKV